MKLLFDENLSRRLVPFLQTAYPGSTQVALIGLECADDRSIWQYAREQGFVTVTKELSAYFAAEPLPPPWERLCREKRS
ncbi:MAG: DUF5615 family PIN-like protein [Gammaproteobacteria bacterium]|nr:DUF5615 family PIN-like protein [Gammaproteobacteria bacterium]MBU1654896.1 DUF5615 family PIN-like protein [Gammaproteobacteria bacterium]MBU1960587.1 DUF5615 family PIN-like protein [Gammaproteobacteria bacterium]